MFVKKGEHNQNSKAVSPFLKRQCDTPPGNKLQALLTELQFSSLSSLSKFDLMTKYFILSQICPQPLKIFKPKSFNHLCFFPAKIADLFLLLLQIGC